MADNAGSELRYNKEYFEKGGNALAQVDRAFLDYRDLAVLPHGMTIKAPPSRMGEYLLVLRGTDEAGSAMVAFHSAVGLVEAIVGLNARLSNGTLKWRPDEFAR